MSQPPTRLRSTPATALDLRTRRGMPRLPRGYVETRAVQRLAAAPLPPVLLLLSPRGFGKTASVSWLLRQDEDPRHDHVWVNAPPGDVPAEEFWEMVGRRLHDAGLEDGDWDALDRSLARRHRRLVLVVDDLERVEESVDDRLATIVGSHENISLVAMSRHRRPLLESVELLDGAVLRAPDLRLSSTEVSRMAARLGHEITPATAADLAAQLSGWPALLRLALAESTVDRTGKVVLDQTMIDRYVRQRLSDILDPELATVLSVVAVPESITPELAHVLVGRERLETLARSLADDGDVVPDPADVALADPIRQAVATVLAEDEPEVYRETNVQVSRWFAQHSQPAAALRHALEAESWDAVAAMLRQHWASLLTDHTELARRAIEQLPAEMVESDARFLVARDYILNLFVEERAKAAYEGGLLVPDGAARTRSGRRLLLRQVLTLHNNGLYDSATTLVESRDLADAIDESGWPADVVARMPELLLEWATALLLGAPGVTASYAFAEAASWAEHVGDATTHRDAAAGAALSHVALGHTSAAREWLTLLEALPPGAPGSSSDVMERFARAYSGQHSLSTQTSDLEALDDLVIPDELADLEVLRVRLRASQLISADRGREAVRLLEGFRILRSDTASVSLVEHVLVASSIEAYLAASQVERARRLLLEVDPGMRTHSVAWALVDFQSGEYDRVLEAVVGDSLVPRQTLELSLLRACASLRLQQRAAAIDAFQNAVSAAALTKMVRPFVLIPAADLAELADGDLQIRELLGSLTELHHLLPEPQDGSGLSPRELQVLEVVATGASFAAVASRLYVSPNTVKSQMRDIYRKLAVRGREHAVERARELGLLRR